MSEYEGVTSFLREGTIFDAREHSMNNRLTATAKEMRDTKSASTWLYRLNHLAELKKNGK